MIETTIMLKPQSEWRPGMTKEKLVNELMEKMRLGARITCPDFSSRLKTAF